jgi:hypothetical protein
MKRRPCLALAVSLLAMGALARPPACAEDTAAANKAAADTAAADTAAEAPAEALGAPPPAAAVSKYGMGGVGEGDFDSLAREALPVEIATSTYYELVAMARKLGLSDAGSAEELRARLYDHYGVKEPPKAAEGKGRAIKIERASEASYAKVEEDGEIVRASGGVILSLVDSNGDSHRVEADRIVYDRATGSMTARGSVRYERKTGNATEIFSGEALSASVEDWSGVFLDGSIRRSGGSSAGSAQAAQAGAAGQPGTGAAASGERGVVISADVVTKRSSEVMVLKDGVVSACDAADPHYSIRAGKIWILGDREWAFSNAVFSLGNVPIVWLPFFYYPGEEIVFHPVMGYRTREGRFVQTTTYLKGSKPKKTEKTSILTMMDNGPEKPTKLNGVFLRRVAGSPPKDEGTLKVMADAYSGLGGFAGIQGSLPKLGFLGKTDLFAGFGLSRSLFAVSGGGYSPYAAAGGWESVWNESSLFGMPLPVRYGLDASTSLSLGSLSLSLAAPIYSDPYLDRDFRNRSEDMDWLKLFSSSEEAGTSATLRTQLQPKLDATLSLQTKALSPWIQSLNVTKFSSYLSFSSKDRATPADAAQAALLAVDPSRKFFYPSTLRPIDVTIAMKGSLTPEARKPAAAASAGGEAGLGLRSPWSEDAEGDGEAKAPGGAAGPGAGAEATAEGQGGFRAPATLGSTAVPAPAGWSGSTSWSLSPAAYLEEAYRSDDVLEPEDIDFERQYSLQSYRLSAALDGSLSYGNDLLKGSMGLTFATQGQDRPYIYDEESATADGYRLADFQAKSRRVGGKASLSAKPLSGSWLWALSSLSWSMDATLYNLKYKTQTGSGSSSEPVYDESFLSWDPASITSHNVSAFVCARPGGLSQSLTLTASLPPASESYSGKLSLDAGPIKLSADGRLYRKTPSDDFTFGAVTADLTVGGSSGPRATDSLKYDPEAGEISSNALTASWGPFSSSFSLKTSEAYKPTASVGWVAIPGSESLRPSELSASIKPKFKSAAGAAPLSWSLSPGASLSQNLLQFSKSTLSLSLSASLSLRSDLTLTVDASSQNSAAWRYYPGLFEESLSAASRNADDFYVNPLRDLWDSISLWDQSALERGLIKLKSLSLSAVADLHDWTLTMKVAANPKLADDGRSYYLDSSLSLLLTWKDFSDIKADIKVDKANGLTY